MSRSERPARQAASGALLLVVGGLALATGCAAESAPQQQASGSSSSGAPGSDPDAVESAAEGPAPVGAQVPEPVAVQPAPSAQSAQALEVGAQVEGYVNFQWMPVTIAQIGGGPWPDSPYKVAYGAPINGIQTYQWIGPDKIRALSGPAVDGLPPSGPRTGEYLVLSTGNPSQPPLVLGRVQILQGRRYRYTVGSQLAGEGTYEYVGGLVRWLSGPFFDYGWQGEFIVEREGRTHTIRLARGTIATNSEG